MVVGTGDHKGRPYDGFAGAYHTTRARRLDSRPVSWYGVTFPCRSTGHAFRGNHHGLVKAT